VLSVHAYLVAELGNLRYVVDMVRRGGVRTAEVLKLPAEVFCERGAPGLTSLLTGTPRSWPVRSERRSSAGRNRLQTTVERPRELKRRASAEDVERF
jgi:hypothetical protein